MHMTEALKGWLIEHVGVTKDATDDEFQKAAANALASGKLSGQDYAKLVTSPSAGAAGELGSKLDTVISGLGKLTEVLTKQATAPDVKSVEVVSSEPVVTPAKAVVPVVAKGSDGAGSLGEKLAQMGGTPTDPVIAPDIKVISAHEQYSTTKSGMIFPKQTKDGKNHPRAGQPVMDFSERGHQIETASERDLAICGAYAKFQIATSMRGGSKTFGFQALNQHDRELVMFAVENEKWGGGPTPKDDNHVEETISNRKLTQLEQKAIIDDSNSGGLEAAPIIFDDEVIQRPLLHGELFPRVKLKTLERGRRVEGVATGKVTGAWGGVDDTAISLFNTASYVSAFNTTIFRWQGAIQVGLDFLSDTPIDFGSHITEQYGERLLEDLDDVIATGDGTTQPEGIVNKSGIGSVTFSSATTLGNYESLRFGVAKNEHRANLRSSIVFCGTETSYQRAKAIPVGASDARRLGGMNYDAYTWMERPYAINESLANTQVFYAIMAKYRMYRRRGLTLRTSTEGDTLIRRNEMLITATARFGGQLERGAVGALTSDAPA